MNPETGGSRGFGYVEMSAGGDQAVAGLDGSVYQGRSLAVHQTKVNPYF
jgi:RNA recognition motif-containing protein